MSRTRRNSWPCSTHRSGATGVRACPERVRRGRQKALEAARRGVLDEFRAAGYIPPTLMNSLALLGWGLMARRRSWSGTARRAILTRPCRPGPATFDYAKLDWMNGVYLRALDEDAYGSTVLEYLREQRIEWPEDEVRAMAPIVQEKVSRLGEIPSFAGFLFHDVERYPELLDQRILRSAETALERLQTWTAPRSKPRSSLLRRAGRSRARSTGRSAPWRWAQGIARALRVARATGPAARPRAARARGPARRMSALAVGEFEGRLEQYGIERSEEARAVRVGEKETSEQAAIVARYADLFTRDQLDGLRAAEADASGAEQESIARLRLECQEGLVDRELAEREDERERPPRRPRPVGRRRASPANRPGTARDRARLSPPNGLGAAVLEVSASFNDERRSLLAARGRASKRR